MQQLTQRQSAALLQTLLVYESVSACFGLDEPGSEAFDLTPLLRVPVAEVLEMQAEKYEDERGLELESLARSCEVEDEELGWMLDAAHDWLEGIIGEVGEPGNVNGIDVDWNATISVLDPLFERHKYSRLAS